jgi:deoxyribonuclease-4
MTKKEPLLLGAHMSIAGGLEKSIERAVSINCTTLQIFTKSNRQWKAKPISEEEITAFKTAVKNNPFIKSIAVHASYLINIGSSDKELNKKSLESLDIEFKRCQALSIPYLILHPGSCGTSTPKHSMDSIANNINTILSNNPGKSMILLENMGGQGSSIGSTFEELAEIYKKIDEKNRVGFCFDTCHAFVAGYDFRDKKSYDFLWKKFEEILGLKKLKAFHINDSKKELGSKIDRHEDIGKGKIGLEAFRLLFNDERFFDIPKILETPKEDDLKDDVKNMQTIIKLINEPTKKKLTILS